jgi:CheY-like chemotaxis protein
MSMKRADLDNWKSKEVARLLALVETERRYYQEMVAGLPVNVAVVDESLGLVAANRVFRKTFGTAGQSVLKLRLQDIMPAPELQQAIQNVIASGAGSAPVLFEHLGRQLRVSGQPIRDWDEDSQFHALVVIEDLGPVVKAIPAPEVQTSAEAAHPHEPEAATPHVVVVETELAALAEPVTVPVTVEPGVTEEAGVQEEPEKEKEATGSEAVGPEAAIEPVTEAVSEPAILAAPETAVETSTPQVPEIPRSPFPTALPCVLWTATGHNREFTAVSDSSREILGIEPSEWTSQTNFFENRIHADDRASVLAYYGTALQRPGIHSCEFRMVHPHHPMSVRETILVSEDGTWTGMVTDFSARRSIEEQLVQAQRTEAVNRLAGRLAHDLNNPLMIVSGYTEEMASGLPPNDPRGADMREILTASQRIAELTSHLQTVTRSHALPAVPVDLSELLNRTVARIRSAAGEYLTADCVAPGAPLQVLAESSQLEAAILELSAALVESSTEKSHLLIGAEQVSIHELARPDQPLSPGDYARITVSDANAAPQSRIHTIFENLLPGKEPNRDTGPSLARIYKIVQEWGGSMYATGGGTVIRMFLRLAAAPVAVEPPQAVPAATPEAEAVEAPALPARKTILVVEDVSGIRTLMRKILQREGFEVFEASSGAEALDTLKQHKGKMDLLITDVLMPGMNGRELAGQVVGLHPEAGVLYMSGFTAETGVETGHFPPGSFFLQKPFTLGSLLRKVNEVLIARGK